MNSPHISTTYNPMMAMMGIAAGLMLSALDQTVIGNALPSIVNDLDGFEYYAWIATVYLLSSIIAIPVFGRLGDYYGRKPFVIAACAVFTSASALCALANSIELLLLARGLQGLGGGMLIGTAFACIPDLFPDNRKRLKWQIFLSSAFSLVNALGPPLGGLMTDLLGWRSIFLLNIPFGILAVYLLWKHLPLIHHSAPTKRSLDWCGALLIGVMLCSMQFSIEYYAEHGLSMITTAALVTLLMTAILFIKRESTARSPLVPLSLFKNHNLNLLLVLSVMAGSVMFSLLFYTPLMFQGAFQYSAQEAGILLTPMVLSITLGAILNSKIITRLNNPNWLPMMGLALLITGCLLLSQTDKDTAFEYLLMLMLICGCGLGFIFINLTLFTQNSVEKPDLGIATALSQSLRLVGGMLGTAITGAMISSGYKANLENALTHAGLMKDYVTLSSPSALLNPTAELAEQSLTIAQGILLEALADGLMVSAVIAAAALLISTTMKPLDLFGKKGIELIKKSTITNKRNVNR